MFFCYNVSVYVFGEVWFATIAFFFALTRSILVQYHNFLLQYLRRDLRWGLWRVFCVLWVNLFCYNHVGFASNETIFCYIGILCMQKVGFCGILGEIDFCSKRNGFCYFGIIWKQMRDWGGLGQHVYPGDFGVLSPGGRSACLPDSEFKVETWTFAYFKDDERQRLKCY
jgi:hypothetical protein